MRQFVLFLAALACGCNSPQVWQPEPIPQITVCQSKVVVAKGIPCFLAEIHVHGRFNKLVFESDRHLNRCIFADERFDTDRCFITRSKEGIKLVAFLRAGAPGEGGFPVTELVLYHRGKNSLRSDLYRWWVVGTKLKPKRPKQVVYSLNLVFAGCATMAGGP